MTRSAHARGRRSYPPRDSMQLKPPVQCCGLRLRALPEREGGGGLARGVGGDFFYFSLSLAGFGELLYLLKQCGAGVLDLVTGVRSALPAGLGACLRALLW